MGAFGSSLQGPPGNPLDDQTPREEAASGCDGCRYSGLASHVDHMLTPLEPELLGHNPSMRPPSSWYSKSSTRAELLLELFAWILGTFFWFNPFWFLPKWEATGWRAGLPTRGPISDQVLSRAPRRQFPRKEPPSFLLFLKLRTNPPQNSLSPPRIFPGSECPLLATRNTSIPSSEFGFASTHNLKTEVSHFPSWPHFNKPSSEGSAPEKDVFLTSDTKII